MKLEHFTVATEMFKVAPFTGAWIETWMID